MPSYDIICNDCEHVWEIVRPMKDNDKLGKCPECKSKDVQIYLGGGIRTNVFEKRFFEHLSPEGVFIESKSHLRRECKERGFDPQKVPALN